MWFTAARLYWGRLYLVGAVFFLTAALMPLGYALAPLVFGMVNGVCLSWVGFTLRGQPQSPYQAVKNCPASS
jgi:hypothetical protein